MIVVVVVIVLIGNPTEDMCGLLFPGCAKSWPVAGKQLAKIVGLGGLEKF